MGDYEKQALISTSGTLNTVYDIQMQFIIQPRLSRHFMTVSMHLTAKIPSADPI